MTGRCKEGVRESSVAGEGNKHGGKDRVEEGVTWKQSDWKMEGRRGRTSDYRSKRIKR